MNILHATLDHVTSSEHLSCISANVGNETFHLLLAEPFNVVAGTPVTLAFKETEVILSPDSVPCTANTAFGIIRDIHKGTILSEVLFEYHNAILSALVPTLTFSALRLEIGMKIAWSVQPSEISLMRRNGGE